LTADSDYDFGNWDKFLCRAKGFFKMKYETECEDFERDENTSKDEKRRSE